MSKSVEDILREVEGLDEVKGAAPPAKRASAPVSTKRERLRSTGSLVFIVAAILIAVVGSLPFGSYALYPFALLVTMVHETGHALAAIITGGAVASLSVSPDLSGVTRFSGGIQALVAPAGYLGATVAGAGLLLAPLRWSRKVLALLALVPLSVLIFFHPASSFTAIWAVAFLGALAFAAWKLPARLTAFLQMLLGVEASLNAVRDLLTLFFISSSSSHMQTDAVAESHALFLPPIAWAVLWTVISVAILLGTLTLVLRRDLKALRAS